MTPTPDDDDDDDESFPYRTTAGHVVGARMRNLEIDGCGLPSSWMRAVLGRWGRLERVALRMRRDCSGHHVAEALCGAPITCDADGATDCTHRGALVRRASAARTRRLVETGPRPRPRRGHLPRASGGMTSVRPTVVTPTRERHVLWALPSFRSSNRLGVLGAGRGLASMLQFPALRCLDVGDVCRRGVEAPAQDAIDIVELVRPCSRLTRLQVFIHMCDVDAARRLVRRRGSRSSRRWRSWCTRQPTRTLHAATRPWLPTGCADEHASGVVAYTLGVVLRQCAALERLDLGGMACSLAALLRLRTCSAGLAASRGTRAAASLQPL